MPKAPSLTFGPGARLASGSPFQRVFQYGHKSTGRSLILWYYTPTSLDKLSTFTPLSGVNVDKLQREIHPVRLGLSVSAKVGGAVQRNRLKRLIRETFRLNYNQLKPGYDIVAYIRPGCRWRTLSDAQKDFLDLSRKAGLTSDKIHYS